MRPVRAESPVQGPTGDRSDMRRTADGDDRSTSPQSESTQENEMGAATEPGSSPEPDKEKDPKPLSWWDQKYMTGDWGGARTELKEQGIELKIKLMNQFMVNTYGGLETKNGHDFAGSYELNLYLDFENMGWIDNAKFFLRGKGTWGGDDSDFDREKIGAFFKTNQDASAEEPIFVDKWWWTQLLWDDRVEMRLGRMEPVKDLFDTSEVIGSEDDYFLNRALVRNATIPSDKGLGVFAKWHMTDTLYLSAAALDADAENRQTNFNTAFHETDHFRFFGELGWDPAFDSAKGPMPGHYRVGTWYDPKPKDVFMDTIGGRLAQRAESGDWGYFIGMDQMIWKEQDDPEDSQGITFAARYGYAHGDVNRIEHFWSLAAHYRGILPDRNEDLLGFGMGQGIFADDFRVVRPRADRETVYELYYRIKVSPWLYISPDLQFVTNAGGDKGDDNAFIAGIRVKMSL